MIKTENLTKTYQGREGIIQALDDVMLDVAPGEFLAVQGPSGSGKTTLLLTLGGLLRPDKGHVLIMEQNPYELTSESRARLRAESIGFVFQQFHLIPYLNVLENIMAPSVAAPQSDAENRATLLAEYFGLADRMHHVPAELSSGERQRTALARALLNSPRILLADEPTGNIDPDNALVILGHLAGFAEKGGTVVLVTHDPLAAGYAPRTLTMKNGRLC